MQSLKGVLNAVRQGDKIMVNKKLESNLKNLKGWDGGFNVVLSPEIVVKDIITVLEPETGNPFDVVVTKHVPTGKQGFWSPPWVKTPPTSWQKVLHG